MFTIVCEDIYLNKNMRICCLLDASRCVQKMKKMHEWWWWTNTMLCHFVLQKNVRFLSLNLHFHFFLSIFFSLLLYSTNSFISVPTHFSTFVLDIVFLLLVVYARHRVNSSIHFGWICLNDATVNVLTDCLLHVGSLI